MSVQDPAASLEAKSPKPGGAAVEPDRALIAAFAIADRPRRTEWRTHAHSGTMSERTRRYVAGARNARGAAAVQRAATSLLDGV